MHALLAVLLASFGFTPDIDKEDIRKLLAAGVSQETIVEFIRKNAPAEPLSIDDLTELKKAGAGDGVLNAMLQASRTSDAVTRSEEKNNSYSSSGTVVYPRSTYYYPYYPNNHYYYYRPYPYSYRTPYYHAYPRYYYPQSYRYSYRPSTPYRHTVPQSPPRTGVDRYRR